MHKGLFITGTGTDVGKTYVTGLILKKLKDAGVNAGYYKAAMSGNDRDLCGKLIPGDALHVKNISGIQQSLESMCPYIYEAAVSPHLASRMEGHPVKLETVVKGYEVLADTFDYMTMEGSGGILCPIDFDTQELWLEDVIKALKLPCLVVADAGLGTINHVGLTIYYLRSKNIPVKGIILNHYEPDNFMHQDNLRMCEHRTGVPVIACVQKGDRNLNMDIEDLKALYE